MNIWWKIGSYFLFAAAVIGAINWYGSSKYDEGYDAREAIAVKAESDAKTAAENKRAEMQANADAAREKANERAKILETNAANSRLAADRLRNENASIRSRLSSLANEAVRSYANAASIVLDSCTAEYQSMAGIADKIDNDRRQLEQAWPK